METSAVGPMPLGVRRGGGNNKSFVYTGTARRMVTFTGLRQLCDVINDLTEGYESAEAGMWFGRKCTTGYLLMHGRRTDGLPSFSSVVTPEQADIIARDGTAILDVYEMRRIGRD